MTASQMVCHLGDSYQMATGERTANNRSSFWTRRWLRCRFLYLPLAWPKGMPTSPRSDPGPGWHKAKTEFGKDLERLTQAFQKFV